MTYDEAVRILRHGGSWPELVEAIGLVISNPECSELDLLLALKHGGLVAEQAALALYRRTGRAVPEDRSQLITTLAGWIDLLPEWRLGDWIDAPASSSAESPNLDATARRPDSKANWHRFSKETAISVLRDLPREERLILVLYYCVEMTFAEIAVFLDSSESYVKLAHRKVLEKVKSKVSVDAEPLSRLFHDIVAA